jgi:hypothetical protein
MKAWVARRKGTQLWCAYWNDLDGKRRQKAFRDEADAIAFAKTIDRDLIHNTYSVVSRNEFAIRPIGFEAYRQFAAKAVYFIEAVGLERVKIGYTEALVSRLAHLQISSPVRLRVLAVVKGNRELEAKFHSRFAALRLHGEWFQMGKAIRKLIDYLQRHEQVTKALLDRTKELSVEQTTSPSTPAAQPTG